jgi:hypothetical protein
MTLATTETRPATRQTEIAAPASLFERHVSQGFGTGRGALEASTRMLAARVPFQALLGESLTHEY